MSLWRRLLSPCLFGHAEPMRSVHGKTLKWVCPRCTQPLGTILPKLKLKVRQDAKVIQLVSKRKVS